MYICGFLISNKYKKLKNEPSVVPSIVKAESIGKSSPNLAPIKAKEIPRINRITPEIKSENAIGRKFKVPL